MKLIIITIIKHHNSKHYIHSIFINTYDNYPCLLKKYRFKISRMLTKHFRSELFDDSVIWAVYNLNNTAPSIGTFAGLAGE